MAVSTTFSGPKFDSLFLKSSSRLLSSPSISNHISLLGKPRTTLIQKGIIRCDALNSSSNGAVKTDDDHQSSTTPSALELLKTSGADSKSINASLIIIAFIFHIY
jgi:hypothetical protein